MVDLPPQMPPVPENIAQALTDCGVRAGEFTITYDDDLRGNVITFSAQSGANAKNIECIWRATWADFPEFADPALQNAYEAVGKSYFDTHFKSQFIASARDRLAQRGLLENLPKAKDFQNRDDFAVALEQHCGFQPKSVLRVSGESFTLWPQTGVSDPGAPDFDKYSCLLSALTLAAEEDGNLKIGFVGNEKIAEPESK
jgi:hypothetical protein